MVWEKSCWSHDIFKQLKHCTIKKWCCSEGRQKLHSLRTRFQPVVNGLGAQFLKNRKSTSVQFSADVFGRSSWFELVNDWVHVFVNILLALSVQQRILQLFLAFRVDVLNVSRAIFQKATRAIWTANLLDDNRFFSKIGSGDTHGYPAHLAFYYIVSSGRNHKCRAGSGEDGEK